MERNQTMVIIAVVLLLVIGVLAAVAFMHPEDDVDTIVVPTNTSSPMVSPSPTDDDLIPTDDSDDGMESDETNDEGEANIEVTSPQPQDDISLPFTIEGRARVFENVIQYSVEEATGQVLAEGFAMANSPDTGEFGPFVIEIDEWQTAPDTGTTGYVRVFSDSPQDGSEINVVRVPVTFIE